MRNSCRKRPLLRKSQRLFHHSRLFLLLTVVLALAGCHRVTVYHHFENINIGGWEKPDTLWFCMPPAKSAAMLHEEVELRVSDRYPFQGVSLVIEQTTIHTSQSAQLTPLTLHPSPLTNVRTDTLHCSLINHDGSFKVKGIVYHQYHFHLTDLSVDEGDSIRIAVRHAMRRETLPGIVDVGIKLQSY